MSKRTVAAAEIAASLDAVGTLTAEQCRIRRLELRQDLTDAKASLALRRVELATSVELREMRPYANADAWVEAVAKADAALKTWDREAVK